jgi:hypothetical protein
MTVIPRSTVNLCRIPLGNITKCHINPVMAGILGYLLPRLPVGQPFRDQFLNTCFESSSPAAGVPRWMNKNAPEGVFLKKNRMGEDLPIERCPQGCDPIGK